MDFSPQCTPLVPDSGVATSRNRACYYSSSRVVLGQDRRTLLTEKTMRDGHTSNLFNRKKGWGM
jgi:hypothetical protein